ncbi:MAG: protease modulator HflC [Sulfuricaulis sp.]|uniref:protease modulator HflC n=1 Tax=Sulfuricaulis sp. TaxID=2003553 RepID=UPI0034A5ADBF
MNQTKLFAVLGVALLVLITVRSTLYMVDEREKAIIVRFGQVLRYDESPGLHVKTPFLDEVRYFDSRILTLDAEPQPFLTKEKKYVVVDSFVKWRIEDALKFFLTVSGQEIDARRRLEQVINSSLRDEFGKRTVHDVISTDRQKIMDILTAYADQEARKFGIVVVDVRIQRVDLQEEVSQSVYQRMKAERLRIANELRAQGAETAEKIRADAERQREVLLAEAYGKAERVRGEGDAKATAIYAAAYTRAPEFYSLYRSLIAYKESFRKKDDIMIVDPSADFFKYMKKPGR